MKKMLTARQTMFYNALNDYLKNSDIINKDLIIESISKEFKLESSKNNSKEVIETINSAINPELFMIYCVANSNINDSIVVYFDKNWELPNDSDKALSRIILKKWSQEYWITKIDNYFYISTCSNKLNYEKIEKNNLLWETSDINDIINWVIEP